MLNQRQITFRFAAILLGLSPFLLMEVGLRYLRPRDLGRVVDPMVGFSAVHDLFEQTGDGTHYRTTRSRQILFGVQEFTVDKPDNGFRAFCLGGSTVRGRPFHVETAFPQWLQIELAASHPEKACEIVNCGGLSYASYRLQLVLTEVLQYEPDLIVLAMGHNEFLEDRTYAEQKSRTAAWSWIEDRAAKLRTVELARQAWGNTRSQKTTLPSDVEARLDEERGYASYHHDPAWRAGVIQHFERTLRTMIQMCRGAGVPVIVIKLGSNLRDTAPFKSEHATTLTDAQQRSWQFAFDQGTHWDEQDPQVALAAYQQAEQINGKHALLAFRMARCFDRMGQYSDAKTYYERAREWDICPLRMLANEADVVERVATETQTPMVDASAFLEELSEQEIPGFDWYTDHVHPTILGHQVIARRLADQIRANGYVGGMQAEISTTQRRQLASRHMETLGRNYCVSGRERVRWLERWARREKLEQPLMADDARALRYRGYRHLCFDELDAGWNDLSAAIVMDAGCIRQILDRALLLLRGGRIRAAHHLVTQLSATVTDAEFRDELRRAQLTLAVVREDREALSDLLDDPTAFEQQGAWLLEVPDAVSRARALIAQ